MISFFRSFVRLGKWNEAGTSVIDVPVAKYITHNQYNAFTGHNDIGLVKLQSNVAYTGTVFDRKKFHKYSIYWNAELCLDSIRPICLPLSAQLRKKADEIQDDELFSSGWGQTRAGSWNDTIQIQFSF